MGRIKRLRNFDQYSKVQSGEASKKKKRAINCLENFSNEIFWEIFDYLHGDEISQAFENLNNRFEDLLHHPSFLMKIHISSKTVFNYRFEKFLQSNKHRILSLHFTHGVVLQNFISFSMINSSFTRLESLLLKQISAFKLLVLLFYFKSLPRLFSMTIYLGGYDDLLADIYQMIFRLPVLKYLKMGISSDEEEEPEENICITNEEEEFSLIEYLNISPSCTLNELTDLLSYTPRLSHLACANLFESNKVIKSDVLMKLTNLVSLHINIIGIKFDEFEQFLAQFSSRLKFLNVTIRGDDTDYLDGDRWERLISEKMTSLIEFLFFYTDWNSDDFETDPYHLLINRFTSPFWIDRKWLLRLAVEGTQIFYKICPYRDSFYDFQEHMDILILNKERISNSLFHWSSGVHLDFQDHYYTRENTRAFLKKVNSLFRTFEITRLNVDCKGIPMNRFIEILNLLPHLKLIRISNLPSNQNIYEDDAAFNQMNQFLKNNKIIKLTLTNISSLEQINLIIDLLPRLQYFVLHRIINIDLELIVQHTLLKIQENIIFHPAILCIFGEEVEYNQVQRFQQMIDEKNLLKDYTIHRQLNRFYFQWK